MPDQHLGRCQSVDVKDDAKLARAFQGTGDEVKAKAVALTNMRGR